MKHIPFVLLFAAAIFFAQNLKAEAKAIKAPAKETLSEEAGVKAKEQAGAGEAPLQTQTPLLVVLRQSAEVSPKLKQNRFMQQAAAQATEARKSNYLPEIDAAAAATGGSPGSFAMLGVDNNISASQRIGQGAALVLKQDVWDFGRTSNAVKTAERQEDVIKSDFAVDRIDVEREVLRTYVNCAYLRSQVSDLTLIAELADLMAKETDRFVRSGQRSVIERYLVDAEAKEAQTATAEFTERVRVIEQRLAIELGRRTADPVHCASLTGIDSELVSLEKTKGDNPLLLNQEARVQVAQSALDFAKADQMPTIYGLATVGYWNNETLQDKFNSSVGIGITLPLFTGFRIQSVIEKEVASLSASREALDDSRQSIDKANSQYDEQIQSLSVRLNFLQNEAKLAKQALDLARKRYMSLQGNMLDLREAIKNFSRVLQSTDQAYRELFVARGERSLFNGSDAVNVPEIGKRAEPSR